MVTATWPGGDGADIRINNVVVQAAQPTRVTDYTVPFGAFGGLGAVGFTLNAGSFAADPIVTAQLQAAGHFSYSPVLVTPTPIETFFCASTTAATCGTTGSATLDAFFVMLVFRRLQMRLSMKPVFDAIAIECKHLFRRLPRRDKLESNDA